MDNSWIHVFQRSDDPVIIRTFDGRQVSLNELWRNALTPEGIAASIGGAEHVAESAFAALLWWHRHALRQPLELTDEELREQNARVREIQFSIRLLAYLGIHRALIALPPKVAELHIPHALDEPAVCANCGRTVTVVCAECWDEWPCDTVKIPADDLSSGIDPVEESL